MLLLVELKSDLENESPLGVILLLELKSDLENESPLGVTLLKLVVEVLPLGVVILVVLE